MNAISPRRLLLALALSASIAVPAVAERASETVSRTLDVQAGEQLDLSNVNGSVKITTWDRSQVKIRAKKEVRTGISVRAEHALEHLQVVVGQAGGKVTVETKHPKKSDGVFSWLTGSTVDAQVGYEITVPRNFNLKVRNVNGSVSVDGVTGNHSIRTTNGSITAKGTSGALKLATTNGGISAELLRILPGAEMSFHTTNGRINLSVPSTFAATLSASTTNGSIHSDLPITIAGSVSKRSLRGTINGGGPEVKLATTNGSIKVKSL